MPKGCLFIPQTTSLPPSPAGIVLPHHTATELSHIANCGYSPLSGIHPLLCQEKKPICPVILKGTVIYRKTHCIRKPYCNIICNNSERPRHSYKEQMTHSFTSVKGTAFRASSYVTLLVITQEYHSKITALLLFFSLLVLSDSLLHHGL